MESFLAASKAALKNLSAYKRIRIVLGNKSCDLDSAVSALVQGFSEYLDGIEANERYLAVIPLMNIPEREYRVKTEVIYYLNRHNVAESLLTFRDRIDLTGLKATAGIELEVVLVDHHSLSDQDIFLTDCVVEVIDHRPRDTRWPWPGTKVQLESVGSCATLVARRFLRKHPSAIDDRVASLLRGPILVDTCNFSKEADRATPSDLETVEALERIGHLDLDRGKAFDEIVEARADISHLTVDDLLIKDSKDAAGVPIVGLPILVQNFLQMREPLKAVRRFAESRNTAAVVLIGLEIESNKVARDIAVFSLADHRLRQKILEAITVTAQPSLELSFTTEVQEDSENSSLLLYRQGNLRATRKQILPLVQAAVSADRSSRLLPPH